MEDINIFTKIMNLIEKNTDMPALEKDIDDWISKEKENKIIYEIYKLVSEARNLYGGIMEERCDSEKELFNARVNENEIVIPIAEYESMKSRIMDLEKIREVNMEEVEKKLKEAFKEHSLKNKENKLAYALRYLENCNKLNRKQAIIILDRIFSGKI